MRLREIGVVACLALVLVYASGAGVAGAQPRVKTTHMPTTLSKERFAAVDPVIAALIPVNRKNQAPAVVRRALADLRRKCMVLERRDRLQLALRRDCISVVYLTRVTLRIGSCRGFRGCARVLSRTGREFGRSLAIARSSNRAYRSQLRGRCLASFLTPRRELHLLNRLRFRVRRLASAFRRRDLLDIFVEQLAWDQLIAGIDDDGPTARESWRVFRDACRPPAT